ncbi:MAG: hypothetical protein J0L92_14615 [Deltaproteobacteria bacterium]|nr:hypothetical protein [Deltaproteobacteria bacterium]
MKHLRLFLTRLAVRVAAIGLAVGLLYALVLLERFVLAVLPAGASAWWVDHPSVQPIVDIPIALSAMVAVFVAGNWALAKLGVSSTETHDAQGRPQR